ncbi:coiled-coil domain-containing protein 125 [Trichomycterus rosablanca]|uniref:coiled-coil domain-containing protein 125 n=1 Tax=Trichomycterus rosablanca TaxID=2290929 RepID=UPI002F35AFA9
MDTMQGGREELAPGDRSSEDDMTEGDLGDGMGARSSRRHARTAPRPSRIRSGGDLLDLLPLMKLCGQVSEGSGATFSWTSCSAMYGAFRQELDAERASRWRRTDSESGASESSEVLQRRLQEVTEEVELLRTELEVTHRHLEGKHEALRILQGQAILDKATSHTKILLQKSEERTRALEKEVNALQWEITFNRVQFKNVEQTWELKHDRVCTENKALSKALDERLEQLQDVRRENASLSQQCLELLGLLSSQERRDFQKTQPPSGTGREGSALELAVFGACQCSSSGGEPCPCARSAAASRKQVLQLQQELEQQRRRKEEAYVMVDAFRIAFEQQLRRGSEKVLRLAESDPPQTTPRRSNPDGGSHGSSGVAQRLRRFLPSGKDVPSDTKGTLQLLLDLLSDKEEALAHQRKVSYMLARSSEELEKRLQAQIKDLDVSQSDAKSRLFGADQAECKTCKSSADAGQDGPVCSRCNEPCCTTAGVDQEEETTSTAGDENEVKLKSQNCHDNLSVDQSSRPITELELE